MILIVEDHYGVRCDFCQNNLSDDELGGELVTETPEEAELLADHFDWFTDSDKHYCTTCVPSGQKIETPLLVRLAKAAFPSCTTELSIMTALFAMTILFAIATVNIILVAVGALGYGLVIRHHVVLHQRNELATALLTVLGDEQE